MSRFPGDSVSRNTNRPTSRVGILRTTPVDGGIARTACDCVIIAAHRRPTGDKATAGGTDRAPYENCGNHERGQGSKCRG